jgi:hypothetical protein
MRDAVNDAGEVDTAGVQRWEEAAAAVIQAYRSMELEAPDPLVRLAERLRTTSRPDSSVLEAARTGTTLSHQDNLRTEQQLITYYELVRLFVVACRESLQGEQPPDSFVPVTL